MHSPELGRNEGTDSYTEKEEEEERAISEIGIRCREGGGEKGGGENFFHPQQRERETGFVGSGPGRRGGIRQRRSLIKSSFGWKTEIIVGFNTPLEAGE